MSCKRCGSDDVTRSRRRGIWERIQSTLGSWPYRCDICGLRFAAPYRYPEQSRDIAGKQSKVNPHDQSGTTFRAQTATAEREGPDMAFTTHVEKPHAKIVLQADTHEQLNQILLTLNRAVNSYQSSSKAEQSSGAAKESSEVPR